MLEDSCALSTGSGDALSWPLGGHVVACGFCSANWMPSPGSCPLAAGEAGKDELEWVLGSSCRGV